MLYVSMLFKTFTCMRMLREDDYMAKKEDQDYSEIMFGKRVMVDVEQQEARIKYYSLSAIVSYLSQLHHHYRRP